MSRTAKIFGAIIIWQVLLLIGLLVNSAYPLLIGKDIRLEVYPIDPRSLFRGNYVDLRYEFTRYENLPETTKIGDSVYIKLEKSGEVYKVSEYLSEQPEEGVFIRGTYVGYRGGKTIIAGIESFFTEREHALFLENQVNDADEIKPMVLVSVAFNGKAAIKDIIVNSP